MYPIEYVILTSRIYNHANKTKFMNISPFLLKHCKCSKEKLSWS